MTATIRLRQYSDLCPPTRLRSALPRDRSGAVKCKPRARQAHRLNIPNPEPDSSSPTHLAQSWLSDRLTARGARLLPQQGCRPTVAERSRSTASTRAAARSAQRDGLIPLRGGRSKRTPPVAGGPAPTIIRHSSSGLGPGDGRRSCCVLLSREKRHPNCRWQHNRPHNTNGEVKRGRLRTSPFIVTIQVPIQRRYAAIRREVSGSALMSMSRSAIS